MKNYLALTIGPIYKTLSNATKTREAWVASYLFSYLMKCIVEEAKKYGDIILPTGIDEEYDYHGAGIYPDRLIMSLNKNEEKVEEEIIDEALKQVSKNLKIKFENLKNYLNIHFVNATTDDLKTIELKNDKGEAITSEIHKLNYLLDVKELNLNYAPTDEKFFKDLFDYPTIKSFYQLAFKNKNHQFNSIFDIISQGNDELNKLKEKYKDDEDVDKKLFEDKELEENLQKHEKYLAILRADGDNFGKVISAISNNPIQVSKFSTDLVNFSKKASDIIHDFGGTILYIGGDDILAFCPVKNKEKNFFNIVTDLNKAFHEVFIDGVYKTNKVSLSFGVSMSYYKYPMNEALNLSYDLLMNKAKKTPSKNCIAFQLLQHSGASRETILNFEDSGTFNPFLKMLEDVSDKEQLLQSLTHQLLEDKTILVECIKKPERLGGYFENHYNPVDKPVNNKIFIEAMKANLMNAYKFYQNINKALITDDKEPLENIEELALMQMNLVARMTNFLMFKS